MKKLYWFITIAILTSMCSAPQAEAATVLSGKWYKSVGMVPSNGPGSANDITMTVRFQRVQNGGRGPYYMRPMTENDPKYGTESSFIDIVSTSKAGIFIDQVLYGKIYRTAPGFKPNNMLYAGVGDPYDYSKSRIPANGLYQGQWHELRLAGSSILNADAQFLREIPLRNGGFHPNVMKNRRDNPVVGPWCYSFAEVLQPYVLVKAHRMDNGRKFTIQVYMTLSAYTREF